MSASTTCPLCAPAGENLLWQDARCRVIRVADPEHGAGYCRVIWQAHVAEMSDLDAADRAHLMAVVDAVERTLRELLQPDKINLASLGNMVPHLHWHVIARFADDARFPDAVWAPRRREGAVRTGPADSLLRERLLQHLGKLSS